MAMVTRILVLGASGAVGGAVVKELARRDGVAVRVASRRPSELGLDARVEAVRFDLEQQDTFAPALAGIERVFMLARPGDEQPELHALPLIDAMRAQGVKRVVHLSAMGAEKRPDFGLRRVELALDASGLAVTHLRPNFFFQIFTTGALGRGIALRGEIRIPAGGARLSFLDARDVGAAAAVALTEPGHEGHGYTLTGAEALDHAEIAAAIAHARGSAVRYVAIDEDEARRALGEAGFPPPWVERLLGFYRLVRSGAAAELTSSVAELLGRPPRTFAEFATEHRAAFDAKPDAALP
jgi:uncharacterized protein YbjT (DUF2867 family)